ncbi:MAG: hypothetical protein J6G98_04780 [Bacilli bacterium]|nr:hypothetical protein [Bacilli bacterium]
MKKNSGFMLFETLIVSTLVLGTLVFLYVQFTKIRNSYYISFRYNTVEGLYYAGNIAKYLEKTGYESIKENMNDKTYLDITNCAYSTTLCSKIINMEGVKQVLFVNKDITSFKNQLPNINIDKKFKSFIKRLPDYKNNYEYRLIVAYNNDTYASVGIGIDLSVLTPYTLTNIANNSGFENGLNSWNTVQNMSSINTSFKKSGNNSLAFVPINNDSNSIYQSISLKANHIYFASEYIYLDKNESGSTNIYLNEDNNYANVSFNELEAKKWNYISSIFTPTTQGNYKYNIVTSTIPNNIYIDNVMLIDLTEIFGFGNEPDLDWCNSNIKYFDTTTIIYK